MRPIGSRLTMRCSSWGENPNDPLPQAGSFLLTNAGRLYEVTNSRMTRGGNVAVACIVRGPVEEHGLPHDAVVIGIEFTSRSRRRSSGRGRAPVL